DEVTCDVQQSLSQRRRTEDHQRNENQDARLRRVIPDEPSKGFSSLEERKHRARHPESGYCVENGQGERPTTGNRGLGSRNAQQFRALASTLFHCAFRRVVLKEDPSRTKLGQTAALPY